jgi:hypothetical protein
MNGEERLGAPTACCSPRRMLGGAVIGGCEYQSEKGEDED